MKGAIELAPYRREADGEIRLAVVDYDRTCETCDHVRDFHKSFASCANPKMLASFERSSDYLTALKQEVKEEIANGLCRGWSGTVPDELPLEYVQCNQCAWAKSDRKCVAPARAADGKPVDRINDGACLSHRLDLMTRLLRRLGLRKPEVRRA